MTDKTLAVRVSITTQATTIINGRRYTGPGKWGLGWDLRYRLWKEQRRLRNRFAGRLR